MNKFAPMVEDMEKLAADFGRIKAVVDFEQVNAVISRAKQQEQIEAKQERTVRRKHNPLLFTPTPNLGIMMKFKKFNPHKIRGKYRIVGMSFYIAFCVDIFYKTSVSDSVVLLFVYFDKNSQNRLFLHFTNTLSYPHLHFPSKSTILFEKEGGIWNGRDHTKNFGRTGRANPGNGADDIAPGRGKQPAAAAY